MLKQFLKKCLPHFVLFVMMWLHYQSPWIYYLSWLLSNCLRSFLVHYCIFLIRSRLLKQKVQLLQILLQSYLHFEMPYSLLIAFALIKQPFVWQDQLHFEDFSFYWPLLLHYLDQVLMLYQVLLP